jgi:hypothetical protein
MHGSPNLIYLTEQKKNHFLFVDIEDSAVGNRNSLTTPVEEGE